ncbi:phosphatase PAP2 family protein [Pendulispora albinea]|uniref:Phosphatase PAP2 family protein n=1 Tax=Pendulispora albinea TaxID=2741071 RepID=A0ABZ2M009_9BACT
MIAATLLGSGWSMIALIPLILREASRRWALALTATLLATAVAVFLLKMAVGRARPIVSVPEVHPLYGSPTDFSFPSGHSAGSFATAAFVCLVAWRYAQKNPTWTRRVYALCGFCVAAAMTIAYSRVYLGVHFPGDVLTGAVLGTTFGSTGAWAYLKSRAKLARDDIAGAD